MNNSVLWVANLKTLRATGLTGSKYSLIGKIGTQNHFQVLNGCSKNGALQGSIFRPHHSRGSCHVQRAKVLRVRSDVQRGLRLSKHNTLFAMVSRNENWRYFISCRRSILLVEWGNYQTHSWYRTQYQKNIQVAYFTSKLLLLDRAIRLKVL